MIRVGKSEIEFQEAYTAYAGSIHRTLAEMTGNNAIAEELTQEAFIKAWKGLAQFGFKSSLKTWIYQVAINLGRDWLRGHKVRSVHALNAREEEGIKTSTESSAIQEALLELDDEMRELLVLFYYEGMKLPEISSILKVSEGTIKSRLFTARSKLKEVLLLKGYDL